MDIHRLRIFRELADRGTITAVARALSYTPSAVSQQLRALRSEVGLALTEPSGRGLRLTDAGRALAARADEVLAAVDLAEAELNSYRCSPRGTVRVALFPSGALLLLPGLLRRMAAQPEIGLECRDIDMTPPEVQALAADFDIVVTHRDDQAAPFETDRLEVTSLLREPLDIALPAEHRLAEHRRVNLAELANESWIGVDVGFPVDDVLRSLTARTGVRPSVVQRINDFRVVEALVADGYGVALLPRYIVDNPRLALRPLAGVRTGRNVEAISRRGASARPAVRAVLDSLLAEATTVTAVK